MTAPSSAASIAAHPEPLSVAPMMDRTDRHYRYFMRQITRKTLLYTEMITTAALMHGGPQRFLAFSEAEKPLALQLGGADPAALSHCARLAEDWGYDEVNLNVGCPSDRVKQGRFGACLMAQPEVVARGVEAMRRATSLRVTVKHRIGIDGLERYEDMERFVRVVAGAGCESFIVHARIAVLQGLSPRENRTVPPLRYDDVYRLKTAHPQLHVGINGGVTTLQQAVGHLETVDGVMIGRAAYDQPFLFALADNLFFGEQSLPPNRRQVLETMLPYLEEWAARGLPPHRITRHLLGLFAHQPAARAWRRLLSEQALTVAAATTALRTALTDLPAPVLDARPQPLSCPLPAR
jgi:tRNA-dihydrouridine synthase A